LFMAVEHMVGMCFCCYAALVYKPGSQLQGSRAEANSTGK